ncbi:hypothetical protein BX600DRAFT_469699 [Xylariales sp. PMI_506]|nr:hypothetical protein BX600DRAFT_469699 [Xylariales sp. PMI_506]
MDKSDYADRRKVQNREAQRRYRKKQKALAQEADTTNTSPAPTLGMMNMNDDDMFREIKFTDTDIHPSHLSTNFDPSHCTILEDDIVLSPDPSLTQTSWTSASWDDDLSALLMTPLDENHTALVNLDLTAESLDMFVPPHTGKRHGHREKSSKKQKHRGNSEGYLEPAKLLPNVHANYHSKVMKISEELLRLYHFGVELQLLEPDEEVAKQISSVRRQFTSLIYQSADI